jgi:HEAT repeat protein
MAAYALRALAPDRPEAARVLVDATRDPDLAVRRAAFTALAALEAPPRGVGQRLLEALGAEPDAASRRLAALALGELGAADPDALPAGAQDALRAALRASEDLDLRRALERSLRKLGGEVTPTGSEGEA